MKRFFLLAALVAATLSAKSQQKIAADSAGKHINEIVTVCSKVYGVKSFEKVTLINLGSKYPNSPLTVAVFAKDRAKFNLDDLNGKEVCITGKIEIYKDKPEIKLSNPDNMVVTSVKEDRE